MFSSYINGNWIRGANGVRKYIASQGPNPASTDHFWRMVWQYDIPLIVMLTGKLPALRSARVRVL